MSVTFFIIIYVRIFELAFTFCFRVLKLAHVTFYSFLYLKYIRRVIRKNYRDIEVVLSKEEINVCRDFDSPTLPSEDDLWVIYLSSSDTL